MFLKQGVFDQYETLTFVMTFILISVEWKNYARENV
jgi:hypothetical protein